MCSAGFFLPYEYIFVADLYLFRTVRWIHQPYLIMYRA